jgi:uncharacterized protein YbaP (TraB family)
MLRFRGLLLLFALAACTPKPEPAEPALWLVEGPKGETAWLFGTIHSLPRPADWHSSAIDSAFDKADRIVVEVDNLGDDAAMSAIFARLAGSPGQPPLGSRVSPALRGDLDKLLAKGGMKESQFDTTETWAVALILARAGDPELDRDYGIDRAVIAAADGKPIVELEGAEGQLGIFDALPEKEQRDLLNAVVGDTGSLDGESTRLAETWRKGDMQAIEAETRSGLLADPELRQALFTARNQAWTAKLAAMLQQGARPFVAVGAAHMAGPDGLPALLKARGYTVTRVQ